MLPTLYCTPETKKKIYDFLVAANLTKLFDLNKQQMMQLMEIVKPKC